MLAPVLPLAEEKGRMTNVDLPDISRNIGSGTRLPTEWLIALVGLLIALVATVALVRWWRARSRAPRPGATFQRVGRLAGLSRRQRWLLARVAKHENLPSPLTLMCSSRTLAHHGRRYATEVGGGQPAPAMLRRLARIQTTLFAPPGDQPAPLRQADLLA